MSTGNQIAKSDRGDVVQVEKKPSWLYKQLREKSGQIPNIPVAVGACSLPGHIRACESSWRAALFLGGKPKMMGDYQGLLLCLHA